MKKLISLLTAASLLCASVPASAMVAVMPTISADKTVVTSGSDFYDPGRPVKLSVNYDPGTVGIGEKQVLRLDELPADADLETTVAQNADKLQYTDLVANDVSSPSHSGRSYELDVSLNGTYIFAGSSGSSGRLDTFSRIDVNEIAVERPMGYVSFSYEFDGVNPARYYAEVQNLEAGSGAEIKRYALMSGKRNEELPPGSWPTTVSPECRDEVYDSGIAGLYEDFQAHGMELLPGEDGRILINNTDDTFILFIEDTSERYNAVFFYMPEFPDELEPNVTPDPNTTAEPDKTAEPDNTAEPDTTTEPDTTAEPLPFISDTLEVYEAPVDKQLYTVDETGKAEVKISGKYIEPTPIPVNKITLDYDSGNIYVKSPVELIGKKLVIAVHDENDELIGEAPEEIGRLKEVKVFDVNTELVYPIEGNDSYCYHRAVIDVSDFAYTNIRVMLLESLENPKPLIDVEVGVVWTGALIPKLEILLGKKLEDGLYRPIIWNEGPYDENGVFSVSCSLEPGEYRLDISTSSDDRYISNFTVRAPE